MNLDQITFPVYVVGKEKPMVSEGVIFFAYVERKVDSDDVDHIKIVDDKRLPQLGLAGRRLVLKDRGVPLHKISKAIFFLGDLIKLADSKTWFIDSTGALFNYHKKKRVPLVFKPISAIIPLKTGGALVEVQHTGSRFKVLLAPTGREKYAGLLKVGIGYILYGLYEEEQPESYRII